MKKIYFLLISLFCSLSILQAQDQAIFTQYHISPILINPAVAGFTEYHELQLNVRNQWTGFPGAPLTYAGMYNGPIGKTLGLGAGLLSENVASMTRLRFQLNYAFRYQIQNVKVAAGFSTEFSNLSLNNDVFSNGFYQQGDQVIDDFDQGEKIFDATLGFFATISDKTFIGLSFPNLIVAKISDIESGSNEGSFFKYYIFHVGSKFEFTDANFSLEPSVILRSIKDVPFSMDFNLKAGFLDDRLIAGMSYRAGTGGALGLLLGTELDNFRIFYSYDLSFQDFQQYSSGSHEATLALRLKGKKKPLGY